MNEKGFTLVEMLATIVLLALVMGIASYGVIGSINKSKNKSEQIFVEKLSPLIEEYIALHGSSLQENSQEYCIRNCGGTEEKVMIKKVESFNIMKLVEENFVEKSQLKNPANKKECFSDTKNPEVIVYKDTEYVYYYYVDVSGTNTNCDISEENGMITNFSKKVIEKLKIEPGVNLPQKLIDKVEN